MKERLGVPNIVSMYYYLKKYYFLIYYMPYPNERKQSATGFVTQPSPFKLLLASHDFSSAAHATNNLFFKDLCLLHCH